ncbi:MAG: lycopene cyclase domain-containing protein [Actinomycetes bacterium]
MLKYGYFAMLLFTVLGSFWLEIALRVRVLRRVGRVALSVLPVAAVFTIWDAYAIHRGHWRFDPAQIVGKFGPFHIPIEEYLFFLIVPIAAIMTLEAVRNVKKHWPVGDEAQ